MHGFTSLRVATLTGCTMFDCEGTKSNELDFTITFHTTCNAIKDSGKGIFCATFSCIFPEGILNGFDEFGFIHNMDLLASLDAIVKLNNTLFSLGIA